MLYIGLLVEADNQAKNEADKVKRAFLNCIKIKIIYTGCWLHRSCSQNTPVYAGRQLHLQFWNWAPFKQLRVGHVVVVELHKLHNTGHTLLMALDVHCDGDMAWHSVGSLLQTTKIELKFKK